MEVVILAGGLGTRLRSAIGNGLPKCMAPVAGRPFLWYLLTYIKRFDVTRVVLSVGHLRDVIFKWINEVRSEFPFEIVYAVEESPLGTGGGIRLALSECSESNPVVLNGDTFFNVDLCRLAGLHSQYGSDVSIALKPMRDFDRYGRVIVDDTTHKIREFCEKQPCRDGLINGGVYCISRNAEGLWPDKDKFSFETEVLEPLARQGRCCGFDFGGYFIDIGIPEDYEKANQDFKTIFV